MKLCAHTMGLPDKDIFACLRFCREYGYEGLEIRCAANGQLDLDTAPRALLEDVRQAAADVGVEIACLTPYLRDFGTPEAAKTTLAGYRRACAAAEILDCGLLRATGGVWPVAGADRKVVWADTAVGLQQAAAIAADHGVKLALEDHSGTLTQTAEDTVGMVLMVARPNFGILMDHYWVVAAGQEEPLAAVRKQAPYVLHCHCKNLVRQEDGKPLANFLDEGEIDWPAVLGVLRDAGYDGYLSDEYEKFWRPELPEPEVGMKRNAEYLRQCLARL